MLKPSGERPGDELIGAFLDGELDDRQAADVAAWLDADAELRDRADRMTRSDALLRDAFADDVREEVPARLLAAARGTEGASVPASSVTDNVVPLKRKSAAPFAVDRRWWIAVPVAASLFGLMAGGTYSYLGPRAPLPVAAEPKNVTALVDPTKSWVDNLAGYHKLFASAVGDGVQVDIPAEGGGDGEVIKKISQRISQQGIRLPNLKPWGLAFQGARLLVAEGRPAAQLFYTTDNKAIGPLTVVVGGSKRADVIPTFERRQDVNVLYWRRHGKAYAIIGQADAGYMWGLANDIAWQMDQI